MTYLNNYVFDCLGFSYMVYFFLRDNDIVHCDLSLDNMLFHMDEDHMYIGTYDWGFAFRINFPRTSIYNYGTVEKTKKIKPNDFGWILHYLLSMDKKK